MNAGRTTIISTLVLLAVFSSTSVAAIEIYHWVDENGVPHYGQYRPAGSIPGVSKLTLEDTTPPGSGQVEDIYNVEAQEKRMATWREEREKKRKEASERKRQIAQQQPASYPQRYRKYSRGYWYPPAYGRPHHRPSPKQSPEPPHRIAIPQPNSGLFPKGGFP